MAFLIETLVCAVIVFLLTVFFNVLRQKDIPLINKFPWGRWCTALFLGGAVGGLISGAMQGALSGGIGNWAAYGAAIGLMQWIVLSRYIPVGIFWALASTLGWSSLALFQAIHIPTPIDWFLTGIVVGVLQWFFLKGKATNTEWWILLNGLAWLFGGFAGIFGGMLFLQFTGNPVLTWVLGWAFVGLLGALILGISAANMHLIPNMNEEEIR
jgi:hypothetical protein